VKRELIASSAFTRAVKRIAKKDRTAVESIKVALVIIAENAFDPRLRTHKLKGDLDGFWACSAGYDLRIVFAFLAHEGAEAILLVSCGTHDAVY
jgi:addiction module RelE/StbE family toxin